MKHYWQPATSVMAVACLLMAGCATASRWERSMQGLGDDPMASASREGLELLGENVPENKGPKPDPPGITRCYKITIPFKEALEAVLGTAEEHGWVEASSLRYKEGTVARKEIGSPNGHLGAYSGTPLTGSRQGGMLLG